MILGGFSNLNDPTTLVTSYFHGIFPASASTRDASAGNSKVSAGVFILCSSFPMQKFLHFSLETIPHGFELATQSRVFHEPLLCGILHSMSPS